MKTSSKFRKFCQNIAFNNQNSRSKRLKSITQRLNRDFWEHESKSNHSFYVGSHGRHTAVKGSSDIDIVFELPKRLYSRYDSYSGNGQSQLLQVMKKSLKTNLWKTYMKGDGQVVVVKFSDGMRFEIVPAFPENNEQYLYPDSNDGGQWKSMNPKAEIQTFLTFDKEESSGTLKDLCRMTRAWRDTQGIKMQGALIDILGYNFLNQRSCRNIGYESYDRMVSSFFNFIARQNKKQEYWLTPGSRQRIYRKSKFESKAKQCKSLIDKAINQEKKPNNKAANTTWRKVFGVQFPN